MKIMGCLQQPWLQTILLILPPNYTIGTTNEAVEVNVFDNDDAPVIEISRSTNRAITEGENANIKFSVYTDDDITTTASAHDITINFEVTEISGDFITGDESELPATIVLQAGDISVNGFETEDDTVDEENGSFSVKLLAASGASPRYTIGGGLARTADITINVEDNDALPVIQMSQVNSGAITEGVEDVIEFSIFNDC